MEQYLHYFCGDANSSTALIETEPLRVSFYKSVVTFMRAYAAISQNLSEAGYSAAEIATLEKETRFYTDVRSAIKKHSGEELDIKPYEADMCHLINTYIQADIAKLLDDLIKQKRDDTESYETFLMKAEELAKKLGKKNTGRHPSLLNGHPEAIVLFNNLASIPTTRFQCPTGAAEKAQLALKIVQAMKSEAPAGWKGDEPREKEVLNALFPIMSRDRKATQAVFEIIMNQPGY